MASALTPDQQAALDSKKVALRMENEKYLREHPELKQMMNGFFLEVLNRRPTNIEVFAAVHFTGGDAAASGAAAEGSGPGSGSGGGRP